MPVITGRRTNKPVLPTYYYTTKAFVLQRAANANSLWIPLYLSTPGWLPGFVLYTQYVGAVRGYFGRCGGLVSSKNWALYNSFPMTSNLDLFR